MQRQADSSGSDHEEVGDSEMPELYSKKTPDLHSQREAGVFDVAKHRGNTHNGKANPEEVEEAMEVSVVAFRIEMADARGELDGRKDATTLFGSSLLASSGKGLDGRRRIFGDRRGTTTVQC